MHPYDMIYIEKKVIDNPLTQKIRAKLSSVPVEIVDDYSSIGMDKPFIQRAAQDKNSIALAERKGKVLKNIGRMEEGQYYLFHEIDCKYDCEYCYLQYYFQTKVPVIFVNREKALQEMEEVLRSHPSPYFHIGEVSDALAMDYLTEFSLDVADLLARYPHGCAEFRTKSTNIDNLISLDPPASNIIPSWTLSPQFVAEAVEHKTPNPIERIRAARTCQNAGYTVGVRLDPIIYFEGWETHYESLIRLIFQELKPEKIDYISLGTPKIHKILLDAIRTRTPSSMVVLGELFPLTDGKYRYLKFRRIDIYNKMMSWIRKHDHNIRVELSLESEEVEEAVY